MKEEEKQHITLHLDAHTIPLKVKRDEESYYRRAATYLNQRFKYYRSHQPKASVEQLWMYVALECGAELQRDTRRHSIEPVENKLQEINQLIEQAIKEPATI